MWGRNSNAFIRRGREAHCLFVSVWHAMGEEGLQGLLFTRLVVVVVKWVAAHVFSARCLDVESEQIYFDGSN